MHRLYFARNGFLKTLGMLADPRQLQCFGWRRKSVFLIGLAGVRTVFVPRGTQCGGLSVLKERWFGMVKTRSKPNACRPIISPRNRTHFLKKWKPCFRARNLIRCRSEVTSVSCISFYPL